ncbi:hypothetical protein D5S18_23215 [Nocardia panacis]|uniref:Uncharacterized protein n=1 Tax=Nocardia panacis TaxID=2340916 RepID=A0A3A4KDZ0_9NOCA|nr:hypothetical protein [Nocardia panacis]RJO72091.1 hypothetical protein D5S18_23215 [Nocardia panacis]
MIKGALRFSGRGVIVTIRVRRTISPPHSVIRRWWANLLWTNRFELELFDSELAAAWSELCESHLPAPLTHIARTEFHDDHERKLVAVRASLREEFAPVLRETAARTSESRCAPNQWPAMPKKLRAASACSPREKTSAPS